MKVPRVYDRVRVEGHHGPLPVVLLDQQRGVVDLACVDRVGFLPHASPGIIRPISESDEKKL